MRPLLRALATLSAFELASVVALFGNLLTVHSPDLASVLGPVHGTLYLGVATTALLGRDLRMRTRLYALVPLAGGVLILGTLRGEAARGTRRGDQPSRPDPVRASPR